jgi:hypothetical protein
MLLVLLLAAGVADTIPAAAHGVPGAPAGTPVPVAAAAVVAADTLAPAVIHPAAFLPAAGVVRPRVLPPGRAGGPGLPVARAMTADAMTADAMTADAMTADAMTADAMTADTQPADNYFLRLATHRRVAHLLLPVFALQYAAGRQLQAQGADAPQWARTGHRVGATALVGIFGLNLVSGGYNLWEARDVPEGRVLRYAHAALMLGGAAGFTYAGTRLADEAQDDPTGRARIRHRNVALGSVASTLSGVSLMLIFNR